MAAPSSIQGEDNINPAIIKRTGEELLECLKHPKLGVITCSGWNGIGRWRIAEYATTKIAMESHLFDVMIWVQLPEKEWSVGKVQISIAESLGIQFQTAPSSMDGDLDLDLDIEVAKRINATLKDKKFLLVMGSISKHIDLAAVGVPNTRKKFSQVISKVVLVGKDPRMASDRVISVHVDIERGLYTAADVLELFRDETAHSLATTEERYFTQDAIMDFFMYLSIFLVRPREEVEWKIRYWIAEGFIGEGETEERLDSLLTELMDRSIVDSTDWDLPYYLEDTMKVVFRSSMAGGVANFHYRFWIEDHSLPRDDDDEHGWGAIQRMTLFMYTIFNLPPSPKCPRLSTFMLQCDTVDQLDLSPTFFQHMQGLRVLDLRDTPIKSLPSSLSSLCNLRLLRLSQCEKLESLPTSFQALEKLQFLDLSKCYSLQTIPNESFELMNSLRLLDLSYTKILSLPPSICNLHSLQQLLLNHCEKLTDIPENYFERMQHLQVLNLSDATSLKSLPSSLSKLVTLKNLHLSNCLSLKTGLGHHSLQNLSSLQKLDLSYCKQLEDIREASFHNILPKLNELDISYTDAPRRFSFRGCHSIERLNLMHLPNLEVLDLSGTKLKKLDLSGSLLLKRLDNLPMKCFDRGNFVGKDFLVEDVGARIWVSDPDFFKSIRLHEDLFKAKCFSRFYIRISPYEEERCMTRNTDNIHDIHLQRSQFKVYKDIYYHSHTQAHHFTHFTSVCNRLLEICGGNSSPQGVDMFFAHTELITLFNNSFVKRLSDLCDVREVRELKECRISSCQVLKSMFLWNNPDFDIIESLEVIWASDLPQLTAVCDGLYGRGSFKRLKHIYLQSCPQLVSLFTSSVYLQSLETLEIRFCRKLENVFKVEAVGGQGSLQSLCSLSLLQVPKLKSICNGHLPQLQKVHVRGCRKLRKLPIRVRLVDSGIRGADSASSSSSSSSLPVVEIRGELDWWENLEWGNEDDSIKRPAHFRPWRYAPTTMQQR